MITKHVLKSISSPSISRLVLTALSRGDSQDKADVDRLLDGAKPRLMVTDPPYGVEYDAARRVESSLPNTRAGTATGRLEGDDRSDWRAAFALFNGDVLYSYLAGLQSPHVMTAVHSVDFEIRSMIVWDKGRLVPGRAHYQWQHEMVIYGVRRGCTAGWISPTNETSVWAISKNARNETGHSTQKPVECMERPIRNHEGDVYDPFVGSGTTIIAAERQGRACRAMEIEPRYVDTSVKRWEDYTGGKATRVEVGDIR